MPVRTSPLTATRSKMHLPSISFPFDKIFFDGFHVSRYTILVMLIRRKVFEFKVKRIDILHNLQKVLL